MREPVLALAGLLDGLAAKLTRHVPKLIQAREAVENPTHQVVDWIEAGGGTSGTNSARLLQPMVASAQASVVLIDVCSQEKRMHLLDIEL
eukprot:3129985-Amphidinium_carterae.1